MRGGNKQMVLDRETVGRACAGAAEEIKDYLGFDQPPLPTDLSAKLNDFVAKYGANSLSHTEQLRKQLREANVPKIDIYQACLLTTVTGFDKMLALNKNTEQLELNRFVYNAIAQTGLARDVILRLTADFAQAAGYERLSADSFNPWNRGQIKRAFVVPWSLYENDLRSVEKDFSIWKCSGTNMAAGTLNCLRQLNNIGIPEAQYCLGYYLLQRACTNEEFCASPQENALSMLQEAAEAGEGRAAAALGDYYYERGGSADWEKAFGYYTGYGALPLEDKQRKALVDIINHKKFNKSVLSLCAGFLVLIILSVFTAPGASLYAAHLGIGVFFCLLCGGALVVALLHYRIKPYENVYYLPVLMFLIWSVYLAVRMLL